MMMMKMTRLAVLLTVLTSSHAFVTQSSSVRCSSTELKAVNRRDALGLAFGLLAAAGSPLASNAVSDPALQTFKGRKKTKGSFIPGKGIREHEEFESLVSVSNPALQTFKGGKKTKGSFIPGKGLHGHEDYESLVAVSNPALQTFKGGKKTKGSFIPGKGLHEHDDFESLVAVSNPALQTFKGGKKTKGSFIPGKGLHEHVDFESLVAVNNPALQTFKGGKGPKGSFIPGKGQYGEPKNNNWYQVIYISLLSVFLTLSSFLINQASEHTNSLNGVKLLATQQKQYIIISLT
jgi:hypothetical protein